MAGLITGFAFAVACQPDLMPGVSHFPAAPQPWLWKAAEHESHDRGNNPPAPESGKRGLNRSVGGGDFSIIPLQNGSENCWWHGAPLSERLLAGCQPERSSRRSYHFASPELPGRSHLV